MCHCSLWIVSFNHVCIMSHFRCINVFFLFTMSALKELIQDLMSDTWMFCSDCIFETHSRLISIFLCIIMQSKKKIVWPWELPHLVTSKWKGVWENTNIAIYCDFLWHTVLIFSVQYCDVILFYNLLQFWKLFVL